ncbi:MAG: acetolactate decarboxylase, partial [Pricia sp.]
GEAVSGTIVGFYCPDFIGNINVKGFHFHFISDDKKLGGHVMDFKTTQPLHVEVDKKTDYHFVLPDNTDFENVSLEKEFQYKK